jgi:hypothetical protein
MEVEVTPGVRVEIEHDDAFYTLRLIGDHSRYEFCAEHELPGTLAILCELDASDPMIRRRVQIATESILSSR